MQKILETKLSKMSNESLTNKLISRNGYVIASLLLMCVIVQLNCVQGSPNPQRFNRFGVPFYQAPAAPCKTPGRCVGKPDKTLLATPESEGKYCDEYYVECQNQCEVRKGCSLGLWFDQQKKTCRWLEDCTV